MRGLCLCGLLLWAILLQGPTRLSAQSSGASLPSTCTLGDLFTYTSGSTSIQVLCVASPPALWVLTPQESYPTLSDTTTNNATAARHGYLPKLPGGTTSFLRGDGTYAVPSGGSTIPAGLITLLLSGTCPATWTEVSALNGTMLRGTVAANADVGTTGGSDSVVPAGTVTAPTFTGNSVASSLVSAGTPAGTNGTGTVTPLGTIAWPAGVPTFSGTGGTVPAQVFTGSSANTSLVSAGTPAGTNGTGTVTSLGTIVWPVGVPTHSGTAATFAGNALATHAHELPWQIPSTTTIRQIAIATFGTGTSRAATAVSAAGTANTTAAAVALSQGVSGGTPAGTVTISNQGTIAWPIGVPTFSGSSSVTSAEVFTGSALGTHQHTLTATGTNGTAAFTPAGTVAWPAGVPTLSGSSSVTSAPVFSGSALGTHQHTTTATGSNSVPTFTGTALDTRAAYTNVIFCSKN